MLKTQHAIYLPFSYVTLSKDGVLKGFSQYLFLKFDSDSYVDNGVLEDSLKKYIRENWSTIWIDPEYAGIDPLFHLSIFRIKGKDFTLELPFGTKINYTSNLIKSLEGNLLRIFGMECEVELVDHNPSEMKLLGIDFISMFGSGGGCCIVEPISPIPENFLDAVESLRGMWLMHKGLEVNHDSETWSFEHKPTGIKTLVSKERVLLGKSPYHSLAKALIEKTGVEKIKLRFLEGYELVFSSDTL